MKASIYMYMKLLYEAFRATDNKLDSCVYDGSIVKLMHVILYGKVRLINKKNGIVMHAVMYITCLKK